MTVRWIEDPVALGTPDLIVLPGTKATIADLAWLRSRGLYRAVAARAEAGAHVLGICGGYQMLGERIIDEEGVEADAGSEVRGLGLLPVTTRFEPVKETRRVSGRSLATSGPWMGSASAEVRGYEIHMGRSSGGEHPLLELDGHADGAVSSDGRVAGTYLHGLFHNDTLRTSLLDALGRPSRSAATAAEAARLAAFDRLAAIVREHLDLEAVRDALGMGLRR